MKETISKLKRELSEWEEIIANETTDKGLISNIYKQLSYNSIPEEQTTQLKVGKRPKQTFLQRRHRDKKHMKGCSTSIVIREMQIKTTMSYHLTPVRMAIIKKSTNNKCWRGCGEKGMLLHCLWECKLI